MARLLDKIPNFKLPKYKMSGIEDSEELRKKYEEGQGTVWGLTRDYTAASNSATGESATDEPASAGGETSSRDGFRPGSIFGVQQAKPQLYEGTHYKTVREIFEKSTIEHEDRTFILETFNKKKGYEEISYGDFRADVLNFGTGLIKSLDIKQNDKVIVFGGTTYEWYVAYTALLVGAAIAVPVDKELPDNELENLVKRSGAKAIICSPKKREMAKKVAMRTGNVTHLIEMYSAEAPTKIAVKAKHQEEFDIVHEGKDLYMVGFDFLCGEGKICVDLGDTSLMNREIDPEAFALLIFTSGTTSQAKGVMINNRALAANINGITPFVHLTPEDRLFSVLPLHHTYESTIGFIYPMAMGASIAICQGLKHLAQDMQATQPTAILAVPLLIEALYKKINKSIEKSKKASAVKSMMRLTSNLKNIGIDVKRKVFKDIYAGLGGKLRIVVSAAAPLDPKIAIWFTEIGVTFLQGYGLTETAPIAALTPDFDTRGGAAGKAVPGVKIKISEPNEKGEGEVLISGNTLMMGYYEDPEATAKVMEDGWFNSGDIGYLDEDGYLYITGRSKNVIVTQNGKNIYPEEIETLLGQVPEIAECMVYGKEVEGEKELVVTARVIPNYDAIKELYEADANSKAKAEDGADASVAGDESAPKSKGKVELTDEEVYKIIWGQIKLVNRKLNNYKCIKRLEIKHEPFEKTSTMKIKRYAELEKNKCE